MHAGYNYQLIIAKVKYTLISQKKEISVIDIKKREDKEEFRLERRNRVLILESSEERYRGTYELWGDVNKVLHETVLFPIRRMYTDSGK